EEVVQNIRTIITTAKYSVPLFREFGVDGELVDIPSLEASAKLKADIIMAVRKYEPRAKITRINFEPDNDGKLSLRISITLKEES
ncbi:MAG: GPW/gp25 family protein, partial [Synergistaceae bacterium]|nr:GPW/gp25 family protein [Synergistaceae bacterium]